MVSHFTGKAPPAFAFSVVSNPALSTLTQSATPEGKLTTIIAPTGYGKTVLQSELYRHYEQAGLLALWVCLDERSQTIDQVLEQLERLFYSEAGSLHPGLDVHRSEEQVDQRIEALLSHIQSLDRAAVLFMDNLNYCHDETLGMLLRALVERTPELFYLVLASTHSLPADFATLKLTGQLREVGYQDLALSLEDIRQLLGKALCDRLGEPGVATVQAQTEGWTAAVRLMQIILSNARDPQETLRSFSGSDVDLAQMLNQSVLSGFEPDLRQFLLEIALLEKFSIPLCRQATQNARSAEHVESLISNNVFVIPLDRNRDWYRFHGLLREFLRAEARNTLAPERRRDVLLQAAAWCEGRQIWEPAIEYALQADSPEVAADILERVASNFVRDRGDLKKYINWVETLDRRGAKIQLETQFWYLWALVFHRRYETARQKIEPFATQVENSARSTDQAAERKALLRRLEIIRTTVATYTDRLSESEQLGTAWLQARDTDDPFDVATIACAVAISRTAHFDFDAAREYLRLAQSTIAQSQSDYGEAWVTVLFNTALVQAGEFAVAYKNLSRELQEARSKLGENSGITSTIALITARAALENGHEQAAREALDLGLPWAQSHGVVETAALGLEAAVKLWASPLGNQLSVGLLREIAASYPPRLAMMLDCFLVQRMLRLGRVDDAQSLAEAAGLPKAGEERFETAQLPVMQALLMQTGIDLDIAAGRLKLAHAAIEEEMERARQQGCWGQVVDLSLREMSVSIGNNDSPAAVRQLTTAIRYAAKRGYVRAFRDHAEKIATIVNETKPSSWGFALQEEQTFFNDLCNMLPITNTSLLEQLEQLDVDTHMLEKPTPRERELLTLIEAGLSNQQLADRLSVSVATVKWHLYNLYSKLGVSSRAAALAKARALNLLTR